MESNEVWEEKKETTTLSGKASGSPGKRADVGDRLDGRARLLRTFLIAAARQRRKSLGLEDFAHGRGAEWELPLLEELADLVDGVILLAEGDDQILGG